MKRARGTGFAKKRYTEKAKMMQRVATCLYVDTYPSPHCEARCLLRGSRGSQEASIFYRLYYIVYILYDGSLVQFLSNRRLGTIEAPQVSDTHGLVQATTVFPCGQLW